MKQQLPVMAERTRNKTQLYNRQKSSDFNSNRARNLLRNSILQGSSPDPNQRLKIINKQQQHNLFGIDSLDDILSLNEQDQLSQIKYTQISARPTDIILSDSHQNYNNNNVCTSEDTAITNRNYNNNQQNLGSTYYTQNSHVQKEQQQQNVYNRSGNKNRMVDFQKFKKITHFYKKSELVEKNQQPLFIDQHAANQSQIYINSQPQLDSDSTVVLQEQKEHNKIIAQRDRLIYQEYDEETFRTQKTFTKSQDRLSQATVNLPVLNSRQQDRLNKSFNQTQPNKFGFKNKLSSQNIDNSMNKSYFTAIQQKSRNLSNSQNLQNSLDEGISNSFATQSLLKNQQNVQNRTQYLSRKARQKHYSEDQRGNSKLSSKSQSQLSKYYQTRTQHFYNVSGNQEDSSPVQTYPFNKSLITYKINEKLNDPVGFEKKLDFAMKMEEVITTGKHKVEDRLDRFDADFRGKVGMLDSVLKTYMKDAKYEFLIKPSPYHTREEIQKYVVAGAKKEEKGKMIFTMKNMSDFDIIHVNKLSHFTDHQGNFLTKTGHKIDDFSISTPGGQESTKNYINQAKTEIKAAKIDKLQQEKQYKKNNDYSAIIQKKIDNASKRRSTFNLGNKSVSDQVSMFSQKLQQFSNPMNSQLSPEKLSMFNQSLIASPGRQKLQKSPVIVKQLHTKNEFENTDDNNIVRDEEDERDTHNQRTQNSKEEALVEFIKKCESGLQLPFSLMNCIKQRSVSKPKLLIDFRVSEPAAKGLAQAIQILQEKINIVELVKIDVSDQGLGEVLAAIKLNPFVQKLILTGLEIGKNSANALINILKVMDERQIGKNSVQLQGQGNSSIVPEIALKNFYEIEELVLSGIKIPKLDSIVKLVQFSDCLQSLDLSYDQIKQNDLDSLCMKLPSSHLKHLNLSFNHLSEFSLRLLSEYIRFSWSLIDIDLSFTGIDSYQTRIIELTQSCSESQSLQSIHLSGIVIQEDTMRQMREIFGINQSDINRRVAVDNPLEIDSTDLELFTENQKIRGTQERYESPSKKREVQVQSKLGMNSKHAQVNERLIFSRILGHPEIANSQSWQECENCWICNKFNYCLFFYQKDSQLNNQTLDSVILKTNCNSTQEIQLNNVESFLRKIGSTALDISNNWYQSLFDKTKITRPHVVLDIRDKSHESLQKAQWYVAAEFIEPKVVYTIQVEEEQFKFQVPERSNQLQVTLNQSSISQAKLQNSIIEMQSVDVKKLTKEDLQIMEQRKLSAFYKTNEILSEQGNQQNSRSPDASPASSKFKMTFVKDIAYQSEKQKTVMECRNINSLSF
eukprot:403332429